MNAFILYDGLPVKSGGAHQLNRHNTAELYDSVSKFLKLYADHKVPVRVQVTMKKFNLRSFLTYALRFGRPNFNWWYYWELKQDLVRWNISSKNLEKKIEVVTADGNLLIGMSWEFNFIDPHTGALLPNQDAIPMVDERRPKTGIYLRLSSTAKTISVWFAFPFEELNAWNLKYLQEIQENLPFKFSSKNWKMYKRSKNGSWFSRKLADPIE